MTSKIVSLKYFLDNVDFFLEEADKGKVFIYPTDTIYGIGGIFPDTLVKIYKIKKRPFSKKVSVIWPIKNKDKFLENIPILLRDSLTDKLYSLLFKLWQNGHGWTLIGRIDLKRFKDYLTDDFKKIYYDLTIGIRVLNHPFQEFVNKLGRPFITTSANISGKSVINKVSDLEKNLYYEVDWIIDGGVLNSGPSVLIDVLGNNIRILKRPN